MIFHGKNDFKPPILASQHLDRTSFSTLSPSMEFFQIPTQHQGIDDFLTYKVRTDDDDQALAYFKQTVNQTGLREQDLAFALAEFHTGNGAKRNLDHAIDNLSKLHQI